MLHSDSRYPGWVQGWGVVERNPLGWKFAGVFQTLQEARTAANRAGPRYEVRWDNYDQHDEAVVGANFR